MNHMSYFVDYFMPVIDELHTNYSYMEGNWRHKQTIWKYPLFYLLLFSDTDK